jgi:hypothetical protein
MRAGFSSANDTFDEFVVIEAAPTACRRELPLGSEEWGDRSGGHEAAAGANRHIECSYSHIVASTVCHDNK